MTTGMSWPRLPDTMRWLAGVAQVVEHQPSKVTEGCAQGATQRLIFRTAMRILAGRANSCERALTAVHSASGARMVPA